MLATENEKRVGICEPWGLCGGRIYLELLAGEDQTLLIGWNALLVLDLRFDIVDRVRRFDLERDGFASQGLHENLHSVIVEKQETTRVTKVVKTRVQTERKVSGPSSTSKRSCRENHYK